MFVALQMPLPLVYHIFVLYPLKHRRAHELLRLNKNLFVHFPQCIERRLSGLHLGVLKLLIQLRNDRKTFLLAGLSKLFFVVAEGLAEHIVLKARVFREYCVK
jgi:hypothetical protein